MYTSFVLFFLFLSDIAIIYLLFRIERGVSEAASSDPLHLSRAAMALRERDRLRSWNVENKNRHKTVSPSSIAFCKALEKVFMETALH